MINIYFFLFKNNNRYAIRELLNTEVDYVNDLAILIEKYMEAIKRNEVQMPQDMEGGKDKIVFGNIQQIYEWHKTIFSPELEKCLSEPSSYIGQLFVKYENRFQMYVKYCENKPKSEYIVSEHDQFFEELRVKLNQKLNIQDLLIKPVQRIMKYQLMLKEIKKYMDKEGKDCKTIDRAIEIMVTVPKNADDMMNVGRLQGFEGRITAQGRLLLQDTLLVQEAEDVKQKKGKEQPVKLKERRVFLFQQIIIFSEMIGSNKKFTSPRYIFKQDMKVNKLQLQKDDANLSFTLLDKTPESNKKIVCQCEDAAKYNNFILHLQDLLDIQNRFLRDLQHPQLAMQKSSPKSATDSTTSSGSHSSTPSSHHASGAGSNSNNSPASKDHHTGLASQFNDFLKSTFSFSSNNSNNNRNTSNQSASPTQAASNSTKTININNNNQNLLTKNASSNNSINSTSISPTTSGSINTISNNNPLLLAAVTATSVVNPSAVSTASTLAQANSNPDQANLDYINNDFQTQLSLDTPAINNSKKNLTQLSSSSTNSNSSSSSTNASSAIPNCAKVTNSYTAITEDEITVQKGK